MPQEFSSLGHLFAVFVCHNIASGRACVGTEHDPILKQAANDSGTCAGRPWRLHALTLEESITIGRLHEWPPCEHTAGRTGWHLRSQSQVSWDEKQRP
jgi:hypothetical protein